MANNLMSTLQEAGFRGPGLASAWAIVMRESGGNPQAFNGNTSTGDRSWGLFQINTLGSLKGRVKAFGLKSEQDLLDPVANAKAAFVMSKGGKDFGAWAIGPNAYKGAPSDAKAKYESWLAKFPGAQKQGATAGWDQAASMAYDRSPAAVVNGPSPQDKLLVAQAEAAMLSSQAGQAQSGKTIDPLGVSQQLGILFQARKKLREAGAAAAASNSNIAEFDGGSQDPGYVAAPNRQIDTAIAIAKNQVGKPYVWGAESPEQGFDCSGLLDYSFKKAGIKIPGRLTTQSALRLGVSVRGQQMQPGDWLITNGGKHMVMYIGNNQVIAAPHKGAAVQYQPVSRFAGSIVDVRRLSAGKKAA